MLAARDRVEQVAAVEVGVARRPSSAASALLKNSMPCSVWKWYFTQNFSPPALIHM